MDTLQEVGFIILKVLLWGGIALLLVIMLIRSDNVPAFAPAKLTAQVIKVSDAPLYFLYQKGLLADDPRLYHPSMESTTRVRTQDNVHQPSIGYMILDYLFFNNMERKYQQALEQTRYNCIQYIKRYSTMAYQIGESPFVKNAPILFKLEDDLLPTESFLRSTMNEFPNEIMEIILVDREFNEIMAVANKNIHRFSMGENEFNRWGSFDSAAAGYIERTNLSLLAYSYPLRVKGDSIGYVMLFINANTLQEAVTLPNVANDMVYILDAGNQLVYTTTTRTARFEETILQRLKKSKLSYIDHNFRKRVVYQSIPELSWRIIAIYNTIHIWPLVLNILRFIGYAVLMYLFYRGMEKAISVIFRKRALKIDPITVLSSATYEMAKAAKQAAQAASQAADNARFESETLRSTIERVNKLPDAAVETVSDTSKNRGKNSMGASGGFKKSA